MPVRLPHPTGVALTAASWQEGEPLRTAVARFRAAAMTGLAVATMITVTTASVTSAATVDTPELAAPAGATTIDFIAPARIPDLIDPATALLPGGGQRSILDTVLPPAALVGGALDLSASPATVATTSAAARLIAKARTHLGARYVHGATGPRVFDCIGLVLRSYSESGLIGRIGGWANGSGYALYAWAKRHHLTSTTGGQPGDVVVWGGGGHVGIYLGNGKAISALVNGVRIHGVHAVTKRFTAYIHTGLNGLKVVTAKATPKAKSIGVRHAKPSLVQRDGHSTSADRVQAIKAGTKLILLRVWKDAAGRTWYRVNANRHVGWVLASGTRS
jgi:cell wall-associated NlpC family hydrolase